MAMLDPGLVHSMVSLVWLFVVDVTSGKILYLEFDIFNKRTIVVFLNNSKGYTKETIWYQLTCGYSWKAENALPNHHGPSWL